MGCRGDHLRDLCEDPGGVTKEAYSRRPLESGAADGDSPVDEMGPLSLDGFPSTTRHVESRRNLGGPPPKAKYDQVTDSERVP